MWLWPLLPEALGRWYFRWPSYRPDFEKATLFGEVTKNADICFCLLTVCHLGSEKVGETAKLWDGKVLVQQNKETLYSFRQSQV